LLFSKPNRTFISSGKTPSTTWALVTTSFLPTANPEPDPSGCSIKATHCRALGEGTAGNAARAGATPGAVEPSATSAAGG
jgi:hypothetical protein